MNSPAPLASAPVFILILFIFIGRMAQLTPAGLIFCALCFVSQVWSQSTVSPVNSTALAGNQTVNDTMATDTYGVQTNGTTAPTGAGAHTRAGALYVLVPVAMATGLLPRGC